MKKLILSIMLLCVIGLNLIPLTSAGNENLASFSENWVTDEPYGSSVPTDNVYLDDASPRTFRVEPKAITVSNNSGADFGIMDVFPGDHIIMSAYIKTDGTVPLSFSGARIGFDAYGLNGRICGVHSEEQAREGSIDLGGVDANYVKWGSTAWVYREWDFTVPATYKADGRTPEAYAEGVYAAPVGVIVWVQIWNEDFPDNTYNGYFKDFSFVRNPVTSYNYEIDTSYFALMPLVIVGIIFGLFVYVVMLVAKR